MKLNQLTKITNSTPLNLLTQAQLTELQIALDKLSYPVGTADGLFGPRTQNAWKEFKADALNEPSSIITSRSIAVLQEKLDALEKDRDYDFSSKQGTIEAIKAECKLQDILLDTQVSYILATVRWETAQTFKPVREAYWENEEWRKNNFPYFPYYGRGYVQLTWKHNYEKYSRILGVDLVNFPDTALDPKIALFILVHGFKNGVFTGRKISDYINNSKTDFINARRCINGLDHAHDIALLAEKFFITVSDDNK